MPENKEPHFFAQNLSDRYCRVRTQDSYLNLFQGSGNHAVTLCGESSVLYSFYPKSIEEIQAFSPEAKYIFMLRNPLEMAPSYHRQLLINLEEDIEDFETAWTLQGKRLEGKNIPQNSTDPELLQYQKACSLGTHLQNVKNIVPEQRLLILFLEDMKRSPKDVYNQVLSFLEISNDYEPSFEVKNKAGTVKSLWLQKLILNPPTLLKNIALLFKRIGLPLGKIAHNMNRKEIKQKPLNLPFQKILLETFHDDITQIENLTGRNLNHWKNISSNQH